MAATRKPMPTAVVVLPSTTYRAADFVTAAEALGVGLIVASEGPAPIDMGDGYLQIDCTDPVLAAETIVAFGDRVGIDGVVAADDAGVVVAAITGQTLGLRSNTPEAAAATRDKASQRRALAAAEVPQPTFAVIGPGDDPVPEATAIGYPLVIKPLDRAAGQGVMRVDGVEDLLPRLERLRRIVGESAQVIIESYMPGVEVAVEGIVSDGALTVLAIFDKPDAGKGPFFPETILVTPSRLPAATTDECERVAQVALDAIGITHGPVHIELMVNGAQVRVIEVAARSIGGLCSKSLNFGLMGTTLETLILRNALGMDKPELHRESVASGVLMIPIPKQGRFVELRNTDVVRQLPFVTGMDITVRPGRFLEPPPEGDRYLGFVYARAATPNDVETSLRKAEHLLEVVVE
ncbi:MAG: ATP-grasp domain-containing protein [Acidimicrobiia bacterium]